LKSQAPYGFIASHSDLSFTDSDFFNNITFLHVGQYKNDIFMKLPTGNALDNFVENNETSCRILLTSK